MKQQKMKWKIKEKFKQNIGMSVDIPVVNINKIKQSIWIEKSKSKISNRKWNENLNKS